MQVAYVAESILLGFTAGTPSGLFVCGSGNPNAPEIRILYSLMAPKVCTMLSELSLRYTIGDQTCIFFNDIFFGGISHNIYHPLGPSSLMLSQNSYWSTSYLRL
jgi:hypothetical protein